MSAFTELQPYFDAYQDEIRKAKNTSGLTLQELADRSGVPYNNICDVNAGRSKQPLLYYAAATCRVLGLSLDRLCGLPGAADTSALRARVREFEIECAHKDGEIARLEEARDEQAGRDRLVILALAGLCMLLVLVVIGYMIFDAHILSAGLFQSAGLSVFAVLLALLLLAWISVVVVALMRLRRK